MKRFWELDALRGLAVVAMVIYHILYDLNYFGLVDLNLTSGLIWFFGRSIPVLFLLLVGISLVISNQRKGRDFRYYLFRGLKIFGFGLLITVCTWIIFPDYAIYFGILHLIGVSIVIAYPFLRFRYINLLLGVLVISLTLLLSNIIVSTKLFLWLGFSPSGYVSFDYFPVVPWFGFVLIGLYLGSQFYQKKGSRSWIPDMPRPLTLLVFLGKHSLFIYLTHQPLLYGALYFLV